MCYMCEFYKEKNKGFALNEKQLIEYIETILKYQNATLFALTLLSNMEKNGFSFSDPYLLLIKHLSDNDVYEANVDIKVIKEKLLN